MKYLRGLGVYLIAIAVILLVTSLWQFNFGSGYADLSFLLIVPFKKSVSYK